VTKRLALVVLAIAIAWIYMLAVPTVIGHTAALPHPTWWNPLFPSRSTAALTWMVITHTFAVLAASLPFAFLIALIYGRTGIWVALALTVVIYVWTRTWTLFHGFGHDPLRLQLVTLFDAIKLIGCLPALVWIFGALPSNNRMERRRER
jgi:hypothetical protein